MLCLGDFKRFKGYEYGYTFVYPKQWVGDTALELAKAQRRTRSLDYTMKNGKKSTNTLPDAGKFYFTFHSYHQHNKGHII